MSECSQSGTCSQSGSPMEPTAKRRRYSREPDLDVEVEGEIFKVSACVLMLASDVFAQMLECGLRESQEGRIVLPGKSKEEFREVLTHLTPRGGAAPPPIKAEHVPFLLRWA